MPFEVGNFVVHPVYGIGQIVGIEEKQFSNTRTRLYYRVPVLPKRTIWIPVEMSESTRFRLVTAQSELDQYRTLLKSRPVPLPKNHHRRHRELLNRLRRGSFQITCEVVRDLTAWGWRKPLGPTDATTLQKTRERLYREWAVAAGVSIIEATKEVDSLLVQLGKHYKGLI